MRPVAFCVKVLLQMAIGSVLCVWIFIHWVGASSRNTPPLGPELLTGTAGWLAAATGVELAYTLFTDGPDEAVEPAILGLASAMILLTAHIDEAHPWTALAILGLGATMALLFAVKKQYVDPKMGKAPGSAPSKRSSDGQESVCDGSPGPRSGGEIAPDPTPEHTADLPPVKPELPALYRWTPRVPGTRLSWWRRT